MDFQEKKLKLIELFAGYGSQSVALENLGVDFEMGCISEWDWHVNRSYKALHISDNTDYSKGLEQGDIVSALINLGISADGRSPMTRAQILRKGSVWQRTIYNEFKQTKNLGSISLIHGSDLNITDTEHYNFMVTYSFPCTSLSLAGLRAGMAEGSGTPSGLLWEVKRLLSELTELPQVLFMENVPQVLSRGNLEHFERWYD